MSSDDKKVGLFNFRKAKSAPSGGPMLTPDTTPIRKAKGFKRIRGLLTGENRKQRKARKAADRNLARSVPVVPASNAATNADDDDMSTVYGVDVDDRSVATGLGNSNTATNNNNSASESAQTAGVLGTKTDDTDEDGSYMLKVVLLLMDPDTRRFELLQLEFDSSKALVNDVLAQIPVSVTEDALRRQKYVGICGAAGKEMSSTELLANFCKGNDVLVAIPENVPAKECARLARPILSDDKVVEMLAASGIDAKPWKEAKKKSKKSSSSSSSTKDKEVTLSSSNKASKSKSAIATLASVALLGVLLQVVHMYISAPIRPGHTVSSGLWLSKCGLLGFLPTCENEYLKVHPEHGKVTVHDKDHKLAWEMQGGVCHELDENCVKGLQFKEDRSVVIGGKTVYFVSKYKHAADLSPWPFSEAPKLKTWKKQ